MFGHLRRIIAVALTGGVLAGSLVMAPAMAAEQPPQPVPNCTISYHNPASPDRIAYAVFCTKLDDLAPLAAFPTLEYIISAYSFDNQSQDSVIDFSALQKLPALKELALGSMTDEGMQYLGGLSQLTTLYISGTFSDISSLQYLQHLKGLGLSSRNITSIAALSTLTELETVIMNTADLTDLSPLKNSKKLSDVVSVSANMAAPRTPIRIGVPFMAPKVIGIDGVSLAPNLARTPDVQQLGNGQLVATGYGAGALIWETVGTKPATLPTMWRYEITVVKYFDVAPSMENMWWDNIYGPDRYSTSAAISQSAYPSTAPVVYLASGANYPDALVAGPAAAVEGGPLLLTAPTVLPSSVRAELQRLKPQKVVVVGGPGAVSAEVFNAVAKLVPNTVRRSGVDRYAVARAVAAETPWTSTTAYVASGQVFPDALSAAAPAGAQGSPVILVPGSASGVNAETTALMSRLGIDKTIVAGGPGTVSEGMLSSLSAFGAVRIGGADRYAVNRTLNAELVKKANKAYFASGEVFPDALAGSAVAAVQGAPLYLARKQCISKGMFADLQVSPVQRVTGFGGYAVVNLLPTATGQVPTCN